MFRIVTFIEFNFLMETSFIKYVSGMSTGSIIVVVVVTVAIVCLVITVIIINRERGKQFFPHMT